MTSDATKTAFFYGTLMHPIILKRIIKNEARHLWFSPALLEGYERWKVKGETYPGMIDARAGHEDEGVRGTLVEGLTGDDMKRLDRFEDLDVGMYKRVSVLVLPLVPFLPFTQHPEDEEGLIRLHDPRLTPKPREPGQSLPMVSVETYVYRDVEELEEVVWSWERFVREDAKEWFEYEDDDD